MLNKQVIIRCSPGQGMGVQEEKEEVQEYRVTRWGGSVDVGSARPPLLCSLLMGQVGPGCQPDPVCRHGGGDQQW